MTREKILVAIDFSPDSDHALGYAIDLGRQLESVLILAHVIHTRLPHAAETRFPDMWEYIRTEADAQMNTRRQRATGAGLRAGAVVETGIPAAKIVQVANNEEAGLIVMGTHGRTGLHHILLGSVAERVVGLSPCPVLTVPRSDHAL